MLESLHARSFKAATRKHNQQSSTIRLLSAYFRAWQGYKIYRSLLGPDKLVYTGIAVYRAGYSPLCPSYKA
jgi:hypothetical protein